MTRSSVDALLKEELTILGSLDLTDDLDNYGFETYCKWMFDILSLESKAKAARETILHSREINYGGGEKTTRKKGGGGICLLVL
jgi:hypothetical protein